MPNNITNHLTIEGRRVSEILRSLRSNNSVFDFNRIIPMPEVLEKITSPISIVPEEEYEAKCQEIDTNNAKPDNMFKMGYPLTLSKQNRYLELYGADNWYDWCIKNWDTKWNAYNAEQEGDKIIFQTAWSAPLNVIQELSRKHPDHTFTLRWASEDFTYYQGEVKFRKGEAIENYAPENGSQEAIKFCLEIMPEYNEYYELNNETGEYKYKED